MRKAKFNRAETYKVEIWDGYFKPTVSGAYRFFLSAAENAELYLSTVPDTNSTANLSKIAYFYGSSNYETPFYNESQRSEYIPLEKDRLYLINAFRGFTGGDVNNFWVGLEVPCDIPSVKSQSSTQLMDIRFTPDREVQELRILNWKKPGKFKIVVAARNPE